MVKSSWVPSGLQDADDGDGEVALLNLLAALATDARQAAAGARGRLLDAPRHEAPGLAERRLDGRALALLVEEALGDAGAEHDLTGRARRCPRRG